MADDDTLHHGPHEPLLHGKIFADDSPMLRGLLILLFTVCLTLFLHFREVRVEPLTVGVPSPRYVVAQVSFDFVDQDATKALRQEALRSIRPIMEIDEKILRDRYLSIENQLGQDSSWQQQLPNVSLAELLQGASLLREKLNSLRLATPETAARLHLYKIQVDSLQIMDPMPESLPISIVEQAAHIADSQLPESAYQWLAERFISPELQVTEDLSTTRLVRDRILEGIPSRMLHIPAGSRIVDQGEIVSSRHTAMLRAMKTKLNQDRHLDEILPLLGSAILATLTMVLGSIYFIRRQPELIRSAQKLALYFTIILITLTLSKAVEMLALHQGASTMVAIAGELTAYPCVVPFAVILLAVLISPEVALFSGVYLTVLMSLTLAVDVPRFLALNLISSLVACLSSRSLRRRKDVFIVTFKTWLACLPLLWSFQLAHDALWSRTFAIDIFGTGIALLITAILVVGLLPLLESIFNLLTDITLMEYMDPNNELLRRLTIEAPGTYQHSLVVGNLSESAATAIDANGLFCRVATLYHDIGKLIGPHYFTENQQSGVNIHQLLTPQESAQVIIAHILEGILLGKRHGLPEAFLDIIREHHGTTLVYYFFCQQLDQVGGYTHLVDEKQFRYLGPKPKSKESAIIMIADSLEAASRSLDEFTEASLQELVDRIVQEKTDDGQFDHCNLTFEELGMVKKAMVKTLLVTSHSRIKYPKRLLENP